ncbi:hypothetical protein [Spirosoma flavum]|uniref:DNA gyrase inhibitor YacG n=1 Tax=Spirosoma flavum TaxID=2048557 RepID=A0ABW6AI95_9BACT
MKTIKTCPQCQDTFTGATNKTYCSDRCRNQYFHRQPTPRPAPKPLP